MRHEPEPSIRVLRFRLVIVACALILSACTSDSNPGGGPTPPAAPANLVAFPHPNSGEVDLTWDAVPSAVAYRIYRGTAAGVTITGNPKTTSQTSYHAPAGHRARTITSYGGRRR